MNNVITFAEAAGLLSKRRKPIVRAEPDAIAEYHAERRAKLEERLAEVATNPNLTTSCINQRLRLSRWEAWRTARHLTNYWRARLDWDSALSIAQSHNVADANSFPKCDDSLRSRLEMVDLWRTALVSQMLTPAPDAAAVAWKRVQLRAENYRADVKPEALQRAIDADVEWLAAHPTKKSIAASRQAEREGL